jgi:hypothetical protein
VIWLVQLVFDCANPDAIMQFWGRALDYRNPLIGVPESEVAAFRAANPQFDGRGRIDDNDLRRPPVYIQRVPEPKSHRNRVRLEIATPDPDGAAQRVLELGATRDGDGGFLDVEGNEFTIAASDGEPTRLRSIVIDANDPERLLSFWSDATGYVADRSLMRCDPAPHALRWAGDHFALGDQSLLHITGMGAEPGPAPYDLTPGLHLCEASTAKVVKNRLHVDLNSTDVETDRERLVQLGAEVVRWDTDQVLIDPEGNELCLSGWPRRGKT